MDVIEQRAQERHVSKLIKIGNKDIDHVSNYKLGLAGKHQFMNAAVAKELCTQWISKRKENGLEITLDEALIQKGLESAKWPGRCQRLSIPNFPGEWCLDGAHTAESLQVCADWFTEIHGGSTCTLIFNCTHERQGSILLPPLIKTFREKVMFEKVIFTTNNPWIKPPEQDSDLANNNAPVDATFKVQHTLVQVWKQLCKEHDYPCDHVFVCGTVQEAIENSKSEKMLITGSLHLVGSALTVLGAPVE